MKVNHNGLLKILINKKMNNKDLRERVSIAPATILKIGKGEFVFIDVLFRIGKCLDIDFGDMYLSLERLIIKLR